MESADMVVLDGGLAAIVAAVALCRALPAIVRRLVSARFPAATAVADVTVVAALAPLAAPLGSAKHELPLQQPFGGGACCRPAVGG